jgi:hypothetical protein
MEAGMIDRVWHVDELEREPMTGSAPGSALVAMHFLLTALRRRWPVWVGLGCAGMLLGLVWAVTLPTASVGTVTLFLAHDPGADSAQAQSTDLSLLRTRSLATDVIERLDLPMAPEEFQESVVAVPASTNVLVLELTGPDDMAAVEQARALADAYLSFRARQAGSQLEALTRGYQERITALRQQGQDLSRQYGEIAASGPGNEEQLSALLNKQAQLATEIESAQQSIDDAKLKSESVIESSYVLDPASAKPPSSRLKRVVLAMATGTIGASAVGIGLVLAAALTSNRLRRREEVAQALEAPVRISVRGRLRPSWWPGQKVRLPAAGLETLIDALEREASRPPKASLATAGTLPPTHLAVATVDTGPVGELVIARLAARLSANGLDVFVVDLTEAGGLQAALDRTLDEPEGAYPGRRPVVHRPSRAQSLSHGPLGRRAPIAEEPASIQPWRRAWEEADASLALAEVEPAVGADHVRSWADEVIVLVAAGRSSAERLRTTGELIRSAGLRLLFAMMVGTDRTDESPGLGDAAPGFWSAEGGAVSAPAHGRHSL